MDHYVAYLQQELAEVSRERDELAREKNLLWRLVGLLAGRVDPRELAVLRGVETFSRYLGGGAVSTANGRRYLPPESKAGSQ